jgi:hypothetical protein
MLVTFNALMGVVFVLAAAWQRDTNAFLLSLYGAAGWGLLMIKEYANA